MLTEVVDGATDLAELETRLVEENLNYLQDTSPASRSRAFDWLEARGAAPVAFDPLAPDKDRRAALARAAEEAEMESEDAR